MKKKYAIIVTFIFIFAVLTIWIMSLLGKENESNKENIQPTLQGTVLDIRPTSSLHKLEEGMFTIQNEEDYGFQEFLDQGGASSDAEVIDFLMEDILSDSDGLAFMPNIFGCSTLAVKNEHQQTLFGRNFDWEESEALIITSKPDGAYASISTVNLDFIQSGTSLSIHNLPDDVLAKVAMYAPLDGMNEKGLAISVNMIQDSSAIHQSGQSQNLTTTTAIRLILNKAANVEEAIDLLETYNMHSSFDMMIHFAISDASGKSVVVEYVNQEMKVIETPVVTNFYLSQGDKYGIGTEQSHERYNILMEMLKKQPAMSMVQVRDALNRVSKDNFDEFESTEWSIVYNLKQKEIHYYHRENYDKRYVFYLNEMEVK